MSYKPNQLFSNLVNQDNISLYIDRMMKTDADICDAAILNWDNWSIELKSYFKYWMKFIFQKTKSDISELDSLIESKGFPNIKISDIDEKLWTKNKK